VVASRRPRADGHVGEHWMQRVFEPDVVQRVVRALSHHSTCLERVADRVAQWFRDRIQRWLIGHPCRRVRVPIVPAGASF
jgi:predicted DCC family thiol-disulfide oxidoreductase YuxK